MIRLTKILAASFIAAIGLLFFLDNLFNLDSAFKAVEFVVSGAQQPYYRILGPTVTSAFLTWTALFTIMGGELAVGILGLLGAVRMIHARTGSAKEFQTAKRTAVLGGVAGMIVWYGFFVIIGEGYFHMWQTETGLASAEGAFRYGSICAVLMFYLSMGNE